MKKALQRMFGAPTPVVGRLSIAYNAVMYGEVHANRVLYRDNPIPGARFRQIVVVELEQFQVRILQGAVVQIAPRFTADNPDSELYLHSDLKSALEYAEKEFKASVEAGWKPYV